MIGYVKIEKSSRSNMWYESLVGQWYPVYKDEGIEWETYELTGHKNYILKSDCISSLPEYNRDNIEENK
jgi:hypothetical protein